MLHLFGFTCRWIVLFFYGLFSVVQSFSPHRYPRHKISFINKPYRLNTLATPSSRFRNNNLYNRSRLRPSLVIGKARQKSDDGDTAKNDRERMEHLEDDIGKKLSMSKDRAISALSQPNGTVTQTHSVGNNDNRRSPSKRDNGPKSSGRRRPRRRTEQAQKSISSARPPPDQDSGSQSNNAGRREASSYSSLLPPPLPSLGADQNPVVSSWEEFLGASSEDEEERKPKRTRKSERVVQAPSSVSGEGDTSESPLPSISDLFLPQDTSNKTDKKSRDASLDGVLPVSELFYRSSQSISAQDELDEFQELPMTSREGDDEELPFSAEQSDGLTTNNGKVKIRRNKAAASEHQKLEEMTSSVKKSQRTSSRRRKQKGRKMVRRGMEMLVGGIPINADPPQRSIEMSYQKQSSAKDWYRTIALNARDFGPLLHRPSLPKVTATELELFCEHFVQAAMKWDVCPQQLRDVVKSHTLEQMIEENEQIITAAEEESNGDVGPDYYHDLPSTSSIVASLKTVAENDEAAEDSRKPDLTPNDKDLLFVSKAQDNNILSLLTLKNDNDEPYINTEFAAEEMMSQRQKSFKGFGKAVPSKTRPKKSVNENMELARIQIVAELKLSIGVTMSELESGKGGEKGNVFKRVIERGIETAISSELKGFQLFVSNLQMVEEEGGSTHVDIEFTMESQVPMEMGEIEKRHARITVALAQATDDGDIQLGVAAAAKKEQAWSRRVRDRVVEELLFEDDDADEPAEAGEVAKAKMRAEKRKNGVDNGTLNTGASQSRFDDEYDGPFGMPGSTVYAADDIFLGGGNGGAFWDYSESNIANSPYKGFLGPRLIDATVERARQQKPKVIVVGDVHGCIDELQDLLRKCDYGPGDLVCFLGDLVSKGPDSVSVVQMAREIGAIGVRGNHDFEVVRWHQAIKAGVDPPVVGSEHFHIASCLTNADMKWLYSLPWYIRSKPLGTLFVHAGFVSGINLSKQNPRLMINMRSILPDGTVTSKFFNNWPWARLWDGPQTILFGHDADRGLQQYEHAIGLDTGCVYGGRLTACILPEKRLVSVSARREYFKYRRKQYD